MDLSKKTTDESCSTTHMFFVQNQLLKRFDWFLTLKTHFEKWKICNFAKSEWHTILTII